MCRSIQPLHNYEPPTTADEVSAAALQYVRKVSGMTRPAGTNQAAFRLAVEAVAAATRQLLETVERRRARARWERRQSTAEARPA
jgi:hypothetical protein